MKKFTQPLIARTVCSFLIYEVREMELWQQIDCGALSIQPRLDKVLVVRPDRSLCGVL
jgi:hypothetical protein